MDASISAQVLGQRIRQIRIRHNFTQQDLAGSDYSKSYISAIEQGKARPSRQALQIIASRLQVPTSTLLDPTSEGFDAMEEGRSQTRVRKRRGESSAPTSEGEFDSFDLLLARAAYLLYTDQPSQAQEITCGTLAAEQGPSSGNLDPARLAQATYLCGLATYSVGAHADALAYLERGLSVAEQLSDMETAEKLRDLLGTIYLDTGQPLVALEHHRKCLEAIEAGLILDPNFELRLYSHLAADYTALQSKDRAVETYRAAMKIASQVGSMSRQAEVFWSVGAAKEQKWYTTTIMNTGIEMALGIYEALDGVHHVAEIERRYGQALLELGSLEAAEASLESSLKLSSSLGYGADVAGTLIELARLSIQRKDMLQAQERVGRAIEMCRLALADGTGKEEHNWQETAKFSATLAEALALAAEIAGATGDAPTMERLFEEAVELLGQNAGSHCAGEVYRRYAHALGSIGHHEQASLMYERAYASHIRQR